MNKLEQLLDDLNRRAPNKPLDAKTMILLIAELASQNQRLEQQNQAIEAKIDQILKQTKPEPKRGPGRPKKADQPKAAAKAQEAGKAA